MQCNELLLQPQFHHSPTVGYDPKYENHKISGSRIEQPCRYAISTLAKDSNVNGLTRG